METATVTASAVTVTTGLRTIDHRSRSSQHLALNVRTTTTACHALGARIEDTAGDKHCPLREVEVNGRVNINIVKLDKLKLAELLPQQLEAVLTSATKHGCLIGMTPEE